MRLCARFSVLALLIGAIVALAAPAANAAVPFGVETFVAVNCGVGHETCASTEVELAPGLRYSFPKKPTLKESEEQGYTKAAGHVPFGITDFKVNTEGAFPNEAPAGGVLKHIRTDVAPGLATSPAAVPQCSGAEFGETEVVAGTGFFPAPTCKPETVVGENKATVYAGPNGVAPGVSDLPLSGAAYNLVQREGLASEFGVALALPKGLTEHVLKEILKGSNPPVETGQYFGHTLIEGSVEWGKEAKGTGQGDYHDYFEINVSEALPLLTSRLVFKGRAGNGAFITNATSCPGNNTTRLALTPNTGAPPVLENYTTLVGLEGCAFVPFEPQFGLGVANTTRDEPDEFAAEVGIPRRPTEEVDSAQLKTATFTLPEGMTLNPSAAAGLAACTPAQAQINSEEKGTHCPAASAIGTVELEVPTLPGNPAPPPLTGNIYLGGPESGPITGPPYVVYLDAESQRYGVSVRLRGETIPNPTTGQVTTAFHELPEQPFTLARLRFTRGALTPIANPLACAGALTAGSLLPFTGTPAFTVHSAFTPTGCANPIPFSLTQSTQNQSPNAGAATSFAFTLNRNNGEQYLDRVQTTLPPGLVGAIPAATQCTEAQANTASCPASSQIGNAVVVAGSGPTPFTFGNGAVYLTEKYNGAPYGMDVVIPAVAGPFNLGPVTTRATLTVDPYTARVTTTATLPTVVGGIPVRLRGLRVEINKQGFLRNPTNCSPFATESVLTGFTPGVAGTVSQNVASPFAVGNCNALKFTPTFKAASGARTSKANGASLETTINYMPNQANLKAVKVQLPKQLPSRLTTLQKACTEAVFNANPSKCPSGSFVGGARANTPLLPSKLTGPAILVSHGGEAFPDLDLVLEANGVRTIVVGNTDIKKGITTTTFAATPDVPISSVTVNLPIGPHSALAANANLCTASLVMPTTLTGQNGIVLKQNTKITVRECGVQIVGHKTAGNTAILTVKTFEAGRVSGSGSKLNTVFRHLSSAQNATRLNVPLSGGGRSSRRPFSTSVRVGFVPKAKGRRNSSTHVTVTFR